LKIQEILLNIAESLEKKLGEQLNLKEEQSQGDKIMKENIQNSQSIDIIAHVVNAFNDAKIEWPTLNEEESSAA
jgi:hypothetical protein